jgi:hypothetical protein
MRTWMASLVVIAAAALIATLAAQQLTDGEQTALRAQLEEHYDIVPLSGGVALTPKTRPSDVRLIEVSDTIAVNGSVVTGRELRERLGADADAILRLSYLDPAARRALFAVRERREPDRQAERPIASESTGPRTPPDSRRLHRAEGDRVRVFGDVIVREDEAITGQIVAVIGSVRIDGEVGDQVVAVLGSVYLGPKAVAHSDVVSIGGRVRRAEGAQVLGGVTEVSLADADARLRMAPWIGDIGILSLLDGFGAVPRLLGSTFRLLLLVLLASLALVAARGTVERSAHRVVDNPLKAMLVGIAAEVLMPPVLILTAVILVLTIVGIPLLLLLPFVVLVLVVLALVGFSGSALAVGQWARRRFGLSTSAGIMDVCLGVVLILLPLLVGRIIALGGWIASPLSFLLVGAGVGLEFLAWSAGFGAVLTNAFGGWRARRATVTPATPPPPPAVP